MTVNRAQNSVHAFQGPTGAPDGFQAVVQPAFTKATWFADVERHLRNLHKCGLWHKCLHADLLDGFHLSEIYAYLTTLYQPLDADLTALAALSTTGVMVRTGSATYAMRTLAAGTGLLWSNADGVSGNPSVALDLTALTADTPVSADEFFFYDVGSSDYNKVTMANLATALGVPASALADPGSNGIVVRTALNTTVARTLTASTTAGEEGAVITNGTGVSANPTVGMTINSLTGDTPVSVDSIAFYDAGEGANNKCTLAQVNAVMDHGTLLGLADDDHSQYHNDSRGDARYLQKSNDLSDLASDDTAIGNLVGGGTNRTPTELYDIPIRDSLAANHGKASVASILTMDPTSLTFGGTPVVGQIPRWHKITIPYNQAGLGDQAAQTANATLFVLPSGGMIHAVVLKHSTDWDNGGGGARNEASVGITGTLNKYAAAFRWDTGTPASNTNFQLSTVQGIEAIGATTNIKMQWDASAGPVNLNTGTVGSLDCYVLLSGLL